MQQWKKFIPRSMVLSRAALAILIPLAAWRVAAPHVLLGCMIAAGFLSDVYDGILARRWGTDTDGLRLADSVADVFFYAGVLAAVLMRHALVLRERLPLLLAVLVLDIGRMLFELARFRRIASYHTYSAKAWGILLAAAAIALLCFDGAYRIVTFALVWGLICDAEGLIMSMLLPRWVRDVKSLIHALRLRHKLLDPLSAQESP